MNWRQEIEARGYTILPEVLPQKQADHLLEEILESSPRRSRAGVRHALQLPVVATLARERCLIDIARAALGPEALPFRATLFDKSPQTNWLVVWHQDTALPLKSRLNLAGWGPWSLKEGIHYAHAPASSLSQVLALRVHLDDSTEMNGPLRVLPGTHRSGVLDDNSIHDLSVKIDAVNCVACKGDVVAMRPLLIHASSKTATAMPRRVLHIEYAASASIAEPLALAMA
jgi:ectoine hydroxylase-related dioxygenase (phytanoyl-CoA dioxygenase family)